MKKYILLLLAVFISLSGSLFAQTVTLLGSTSISAIGSGTSGKPTLNWNIPAGKNRVMIVHFWFERDHRPTVASNYPSGTLGSNYFPVTAGGISMTGRTVLRSSFNDTSVGSPANSQLSTLLYRYTLSDSQGLPTGTVNFDFSSILTPANVADEVAVSVEVYGNVSPSTSYVATGSNSWLDTSTQTTTFSLTPTAPTIPLGRAANDIMYVASGSTSKDETISINTAGWTTINSVKVTNNAGSSFSASSPDPQNEADGISLVTAYRNGAVSTTLTKSSAQRISVARLNIVPLLPLAKPSITGNVYSDTDGSSNINGTGTNGGGLYVNLVDINGILVYSATVSAAGVFTIPTGYATEGESYTIQLSKNTGTLGSVAPLKELNSGWGTVGEAASASGNDGNSDGIFNITVGTTNSTLFYGIKACSAGTLAPTVQNLTINCPATSINLALAHTGTIPAGSTLLWFNNNSHTGTALSGTQISQAVAGTYYAFYYDSSGICYSPSSSKVSIDSNNLDSDGDGIADFCDLDDDNDGILDTNECNSVEKIVNGTFGTNAATAFVGWTRGGDINAWQKGAGNPVEVIDDNVGVSTLSQTITGLVIGKFYTLTFKVAANSNVLNPKENTLSLLIGGVSYYNQSATSIVSEAGGNYVDLNKSFSFIATSSNMTIDFVSTVTASATPGIGGKDVQINLVSIVVCEKETDGDGIPDYLDLDSDNDGCPDAVEGGANLSLSQLVIAGGSLKGGNGINPVVTPTSGTYNQAVLQNLCATAYTVTATDCIGSTGIPLVVNQTTGQTVGTSENAAIKAAVCRIVVPCGGSIDDFSVVQNVSTNTLVNDYSVLANATILGGERDIAVTNKGGTIPYSFGVNTGLNVLDVAQGGGENSLVTVQWDGVDSNAATLNPTGLGGLDISGITKISFPLLKDSAPSGTQLPITLELWTNAGNASSLTITVPDSFSTGTLDFLLSNFTTLLGSGVDLTNIGAIVLKANTTGSINGLDYSIGSIVFSCSSVCYKPAVLDAANTFPTKHGITALGRAGSEASNENWPMIRQSGWTVLESKEKGFVVNRVATTAGLANITNPVEGMMVYDEQADCLKIYTLKSGDTVMGWHCFITPACPD